MYSRTTDQIIQHFYAVLQCISLKFRLFDHNKKSICATTFRDNIIKPDSVLIDRPCIDTHYFSYVRHNYYNITVELYNDGLQKEDT